MQLASKVGDAKKWKEDSVPLNDITFDLSVDALTLLGNYVYEFSMKRREILKLLRLISRYGMSCNLLPQCRLATK